VLISLQAEWRALAAGPLALTDGETAATRSQLIEGANIDGVTLRVAGGDDDDDDEPTTPGGAAAAVTPETAAAQFCNDWLSCMVRATTAAFVGQAMRIRALDARGAEQLAVDTGYLINVISALDLPQPALLRHLNFLTAASAAELTTALERRLPNTVAAAVVAKVDRRVAQMRGVLVPFDA
jgi:hypothetical protein